VYKVYDLHCHSTFSDGTLTPPQVVARAKFRGVDVLALTDHDEVAGLAAAKAAAIEHGIEFVCGVEISTNWRDITLHIVGLNIDPTHDAIVHGVGGIRTGRVERAKRMGSELALVGIERAYEGALNYVTNPTLVSRTHFARYLVDAGVVRDTKEAFRQYLTPGNPGYVEHEWASLTDAIRWIHEAGGVAVLAHPGRYKVEGTAGLRELLQEFKDAGGDAIEVLTSSHSPQQFAEFAMYCRQFDFLASVGSDFHSPTESNTDFGDLPLLSPSLKPVWSAFR
jgi:3',5'-nucleoside bisphosphate phosphatase